MKAVKAPTTRRKDPTSGRFLDPDDFDVYKSGTIYIQEGLKPETPSQPTPEPKRKPAKPITNGKLIRPGRSNGGPSNFMSSSRPAQARPVPQPTSLPTRTEPTATENRRPVPQPIAAQQSRPVPAQPIPAVNGINGYGHSRTDSSSSFTRAPPPPPPPPPPAEPPAPKKDTYRVLYDFTGQTGPELSLIKDELLEVIRKEGNGKVLSSESFLKLYFRPVFPKVLEFPCANPTLSPSRMVASPQNRQFGRRLGSLRLPQRRNPTDSTSSTRSASSYK